MSHRHCFVASNPPYAWEYKSPQSWIEELDPRRHTRGRRPRGFPRGFDFHLRRCGQTQRRTEKEHEKQRRDEEDETEKSARAGDDQEQRTADA
ncbi:unnamed protein product [Arctogadus glacialis]